MSRTSHAVQDRLETLANVRDAGISVCAGGIIGMGEGNMDRVGLLHQLATLPEHPESVPINALVAVKGTPLQACLPQPTCIIAMSSSLWACGSFRGDTLDAFGIRERILTARDASREKIRAAYALRYFIAQDQPPPSAMDIVRCIATARIVMPRSVVRLSAGRLNFTLSDQVCEVESLSHPDHLCAFCQHLPGI